jgi:hypothetical protein
MEKISMTKTSTGDWGDFQPAPTKPRYRMIVRSFGHEKVGKNHFGFTMPGPIAGQYRDPGGIEGVVEKFAEAPFGPKAIYAKCYPFKKEEYTQEQAIKLRDEFTADYSRLLKVARSIQWDESEMWELFRYAEFGEKSDRPSNYDMLNSRYLEMVQEAYNAGVNLHLIQKVKEKWQSVEETDRNGRTKSVGRPSGEFMSTGMKELKYICQVNVEHTWDKGTGFVCHILNCRQNMQLAGESFPALDWPTLGQLVFPQSTDSDWV